MPKKSSGSPLRCPPQLYGIYEDAALIGSGAFWLERLPHGIMASFSAGNQATEIDFEDDAGQEMIDFLTRRLHSSKGGHGECLLEYRDQAIPCRVEVLRSGMSERFQVSWKHEPHTKQA